MKTRHFYLRSGMFFMLISMLAVISSTGQATLPGSKDSAAIIQTSLDYIDGFYSGDAGRMEKAIHPDLNKATPRDIPQTGRTALAYTTWSGLVEFTRANVGALDDTSRHISTTILSIENEVSDVKIVSAKFTDYVQMVRLEGEWKIVNVIFTSGIKGPPRLKDFDEDAEKAEIEKTALTYLSGLSGADAGKLEIAIDKDFNKITLQPIAQSGKTSLRRQRYDAVVENALSGFGKQDEVYRNNKVNVLDITDGLAVVRCESTGSIEHVQMYKGNGQWKVFNSISRPNPDLTLQEAMTVIAGDPMPVFTLPVFGGGTFNLADFNGKNVMLIFPRGWTGNNWCSYCPYQYLELEKLERESKIMAKNDLEIAYVMPYSNERIKDWMEKFPDGLKVIDGIKNPANPPDPGTIQAEYGDWVRSNFPLTFEVKKDDPHDLIPVLIDEDRALSRQLKLFTGFWDGVTAEQNIASVFIIDKKGILRFKYIGQMTEDRPNTDFLLDVVKNLD